MAEKEQKPGIIGSIKGKLDTFDKTYNPLRKVSDVLNEASEKAQTGLTDNVKIRKTPTGAIVKKPFPEEGK